MSGEILAFEVVVDDTRCFTFAKNEKMARWNAVYSARDAGFYQGKRWPSSLIAKRAPRYDNSPLKKCAFRRCFSPDYMY